MSELLDAALVTLGEDDLHYEHGIAMSGEPLDPELFVHYEHLKAALAAQPESAGLDEEGSLALTALQEALRTSAVLRTESVVIQAPLGRYLAVRLTAEKP